MSQKDSQVEAIFLGCSAVGKTLLTKQIKQMASCRGSHSKTRTNNSPIQLKTTPTTGMQFENISLAGSKMVLREVGYDMARLWHKYYKKSNIIVFVIDMTNKVQLASATMELFRILNNPVTVNMPLILLYNKIDRALRMDVATVRSFIHVNDLRSSRQVNFLQFLIYSKTSTNHNSFSQKIYLVYPISHSKTA